MAKIHLRIAELRKNINMTQQEIADRLNVSFQSVSKWEIGSSMPDIALLPELAELFHVTADQLLGLSPLENEKYVSEKTDENSFWNQKLEYLKRTRRSYYNPEYVKYLVEDVYKIHNPVDVLDCGCGYGYLGQLFLPYLPEGSTYTGIDFADELINFGKREFEKLPWKTELIQEDFLKYKTPRKFDIVMEQAVLRHINDAGLFLRKMVSHVKTGGLVISIECNREFECDGLYIDGTDYFTLCEHTGLSKKWKLEYEKQGRDYAVAMRVPDIMRKIGLHDIMVRMDDKVSYVTPEMEGYEQEKADFLAYNDWNFNLSPEQREKRIQHFISRNMTRKEAENYCDRNKMISEALHANDSTYLFFKGHMISAGRK